ncbi:hypothetical protein CANINC_002349 [Pichia inconspicua]|uniref:Phosphatidic acid phosphatase type 2/haloperoxidase domain-containing protein n=1 Tax=Pichia inconspicua TaxID=52247 RepID=A0A4T0X2Q3_9ASCO|nr:hypothetical protein CANINC_002349 [[Candida] inconspicua]
MNFDELLGKFQEKVRDNALLWTIILLLNALSIVFELTSIPATRPFSLTDISISYPFVEAERYDDLTLLFLSIMLPIALFGTFISLDNKNCKFHRFYEAISGFLFGIGLSMIFTTFLKVRMAKLRPDFLARCAPLLKKGESEIGLFTHEICSAPFGERILNEGFKSNPSGHSSLASASMLFFSLWLYDTYGRKSHNKMISLICFSPLFIAFDVATSRIYDFKHDYYDIYFGTIIGIVGALIGFLYIYESERDNEDTGNTILPV